MNSFFRKIYVMAAALLLSLSIYPHITSAAEFDYKNGLLDDPEFLKHVNHNIPASMIDNDLNTSRLHNSQETFSIKSEVPFSINGFFADVRAPVGLSGIQMSFIFTDGTNQNISYAELREEKYFSLLKENITELRLSFRGRNSGQNPIKVYTNEFEIFGTYDTTKPSAEILSIKEDINTVNLKLKHPDDAISFDVWIDGQLKERVENKEDYTVTDLQPNTEYEIKIVSYYPDDEYGKSNTIKVKTKKAPVDEVSDLKAKAENHNQVNLNWENPNQSNFSHVTIYRDIAKSKGLLNYIGLGVINVKAADPTKLFETNGTYFIDHSVDAATKYEYLVTTTDDAGKESKGIQTSVTTPKKPNPDPPVSEIEKQENGDYLVKWTSPKEGKVLIRIDGKDYKTVDAVAGSYLIPGKDMVYDWLDNPKVQIIAIDSDGDESSSSKPGPPGSTENGGSGGGGGGGGIGGIGDINGIKAKDVLSGTMSFIKLLGPFIILGLIIYLVPRLIIVIKATMNKNRNYNR